MNLNLFKSKPLSDEELVQKFRKTDDIDLLGKLFSRHIPLVYGVCLKYLKNRDDAQDETMAIFEKLKNELQKSEVEFFKSWLYVVTKNHCLMLLRSRQSQLKKEKEFEKSEASFMENAFEMHPDNEWEPDAMNERLKECLSKLRDTQRSCIELFYFDQLCYQEISDSLSLDIKKVKSYLQNGKRNLKLCMELVYD